MFVCLCVCLFSFCHKCNTPQYLSQMMSDRHKTFRISSWGSPKMTPSSKSPVWNLQHPPSITSRTGLLFVLESWNLAHKSRITYHDDPGCKIWPHHPSIQSGTIKVLHVWLWGRGVVDTLLFMLESLNLADKSGITYHDDPWCQE